MATQGIETKKTNNEYTSQTRIIKKSIKFGSPPFVVSKYVSPNVKKKIQDFFLFFHMGQQAGKKESLDPQQFWLIGKNDRICDG